jgi:hypothetical protein
MTMSLGPSRHTMLAPPAFVPIRAGLATTTAPRRWRRVRRGAHFALAVMLAGIWIVLATLPLLAMLLSWWVGL